MKHWNLHKTIRVPVKVISRHNKAIGILKINLLSPLPPYHPTGLTQGKLADRIVTYVWLGGIFLLSLPLFE